MENIKIVISIVALILFITTMIIIKMFPDFKFQNPLPISSILRYILYFLTLLFGLVAAIWNIKDM